MGKSAGGGGDPQYIASQQTQLNQKSAYYNALLNNVNQTTPYGSLTYTNSGTYKNPKFSSAVTLSPEQQKLYDSQTQGQQSLLDTANSQLGNINSTLSSPYSLAGIAPAMDMNSYDANSTKAENALLSRLAPEQDREEEALRTRLINQGIGQGSQAYNTEMQTFNQGRNDALQSAVLNGQKYASQLLNDSLTSRNQSINEYNTSRSQPLNEYAALTGGTQIQNPTFQTTNYQGTQPADLQGLVTAQNNANTASGNATTSGLFGLGGSALGGYLSSSAGSAALTGLFSDIRLKDNIKYLGNENGHKIYEFSYKGSDKRFIGVMAQEVEKTHPEAIGKRHGFKTVNYDKIGVMFREGV